MYFNVHHLCIFTQCTSSIISMEAVYPSCMSAPDSPPNWDARNGVTVNAARNYSKTTTIISFWKCIYTGTFVTLFSPKKLVKYTSFPPYFTGEFSAKATLSTSAPATAITRRERISYIEAWIAGDFWGKKLHRDFVLKKKMEVDKFQKSIANSPGGWI